MLQARSLNTHQAMIYTVLMHTFIFRSLLYADGVHDDVYVECNISYREMHLNIQILHSSVLLKGLKFTPK